MPRDITVAFDDGSSHVYRGAPDDVTPDAVEQRAAKEFGKKVVSLNGGRGAPTAPVVLPPSAPSGPDVPQWGRDNPRLYGVAGAARETLGPIVEGLAMVGGGVLGTPGGVPGNVAGAAAGYAGAKGLTRLADVALGNVTPATAPQALVHGTGDVLEGAVGQTAGGVLAPVIGKAVNVVGKGVGKVVDFFTGSTPTVNAARIVREALGPDLQLVQNAMRAQPSGMTAGQAAADINSPTFQALVDRALKRNPRFLTALKESQGEVSLNALNRLVGAETQAGARTVQNNMRTALNERLIPTLETELKAANTAGEKLPVLQGQADRLAGGAASKVEDVRRFTAAVDRAEKGARQQLIERGLPVGAARYTYKGELGVAAEREAARAAEGSLALGEGARFAQSAADSLKAHGLKPLESAPITDAIKARMRDPKFAGNKDIAAAMTRVADDIATWTNSGGVIDAWALDAIRKNSVNAAIRDLYPAADKKQQKELAAGVLSKVKPLIVDAIEGAGGTGYGKYLEDYAAGRQLIDQQRLGAKAVELFKSAPQKFVDLVEGNSPKQVEKIFGPGNYDLAKQMAADAMETMRSVASIVKRDAAVAEQVTAGQEALRNLLKKDLSMWRLPSYLSVITSSANKALSILESKIGTKTMEALTKGAKSGQSITELLDTLPFDQRNKVLRLLSNPQEWGVPIDKIKGAAVNAFVGDEIRNGMAQ